MACVQYLNTQYYVIWLSGLLCYDDALCKYWTWIEDNRSDCNTCYLKDANSGLSYSEGVISGGKNCIEAKGKGADQSSLLVKNFSADPYQKF